MSDINNWELGLYIESAVATAVEHNLAGYKARSTYVKEPFSETMQNNENNKKRLMENNKLLMATLEAWAKNWELEHAKNNTEESNNG